MSLLLLTFNACSTGDSAQGSGSRTDTSATGLVVSQMPTNFTVAFIGDTGADSDFRSVLQLIKNQGANMVLHQGNLGYMDANTAVWESVLNEVLGANFPYFASAGNHDSGWTTGYRRLLAARAQRVGAVCTGTYGLNAACSYQELFFILSAGAEAGSEAANIRYIRQELDGPWWAAIYTATQGASYGALFCTFNVDGVANRASCYFMDIKGRVPDRFEVLSILQPMGHEPVPPDKS